MIFLYEYNNEYYLDDAPWREFRIKHPGSSIVSQFTTIQAALAYADKMRRAVHNLLKKTFTGITPEARERMRELKRGDNNPNAKGLSEEHKRKIAKALKKRRGEFHHMYNMRHKLSSRRKTSESLRRLPKRRWALDAEGKEHFIFADRQLPQGWTWGRRRTGFW